MELVKHCSAKRDVKLLLTAEGGVSMLLSRLASFRMVGRWRPPTRKGGGLSELISSGRDHGAAQPSCEHGT